MSRNVFFSSRRQAHQKNTSCIRGKFAIIAGCNLTGNGCERQPQQFSQSPARWVDGLSKATVFLRSACPSDINEIRKEKTMQTEIYAKRRELLTNDIKATRNRKIFSR